MDKLLRISILVATVLVPVLAARDANDRRGLSKAITGIFAVIALYWFVLITFLPRL